MMTTLPTVSLLSAVIAICISTADATAQEPKTTATQAAAIKKYPELGKPGSVFNKTFVERVARLRRESPRFFDNPNWPILLADEVASPEILEKTAKDVLADCKLIYAAINRWAGEHKKGAGDKISVNDLVPYIKPGTRLHTSFQEGRPKRCDGKSNQSRVC